MRAHASTSDLTGPGLKCECGGRFHLATLKNLNVRWVLGLDITLPEIQGLRCSKNAEHVTIPGETALWLREALVRVILKRPHRLEGMLVRNLRRYMGLARDNLASILKVKPETVSRWENDSRPISASAEQALRSMALRELVDRFLRRNRAEHP